ncbi:MAG: glycosyltransferase [Pirellulales bacterium]|nr:glycosyltransferase [Pirellulales bacterium]
MATRCPGRVRRFLQRRRAAVAALQMLFDAVGQTASVGDRLDRFVEEKIQGAASGRVVIIFSCATFTESEGQRPTRWTRELARRGIPVIFVYGRWVPEAAVRESHVPGVFCLTLDEFALRYKTLLRDVRLEGLRRVLLMEFPHPRLTEIMDHARGLGWRTVYDVIDDWEEFHREGHAFWYATDTEKHLARGAELTTATHPALRRKMLHWGAARSLLLPNALEDWGPPPAEPPVPARTGEITLGYFGHLTSSWFDWPLVTAVAKRRPEWRFQIVGYGCEKRIKHGGNIQFLGRVDHAALPALAQHWDVAMIPFRRTPLCRAVDPIKIYEYISLGLPTVVTGMPHLAGYPGVRAVETAEEFAAAAVHVAHNRLDQATVAEFLRQNRWSNRVDTLLQTLDAEDAYCRTD